MLLVKFCAPEMSTNCGWLRRPRDFRGIQIFESYSISTSSPLYRTFHEAASIGCWLGSKSLSSSDDSYPLSQSLIGMFNDPFHHRLNTETIHKWFQSRLKVTAGFKVIPLDHNKFIFELPSRQEVMRVKAGDWFWSERHLNLSWWSPEVRSQAVSQENVWIKVLRVPLNTWTSESFNRITDL